MDAYCDPNAMRDCFVVLRDLWASDAALQRSFLGVCHGTPFLSLVVPAYGTDAVDPDTVLNPRGTRSWLGLLGHQHHPHINVVLRVRMSWPPVLALHLKRDRLVGGKPTKVSHHVRIPFGTTLGDDGFYALRGVIVHEGMGAGTGHFAAFVLRGGRWYYCSDESYRECPEAEVAACQAYLSFYSP